MITTAYLRTTTVKTTVKQPSPNRLRTVNPTVHLRSAYLPPTVDRRSARGAAATSHAVERGRERQHAPHVTGLLGLHFLHENARNDTCALFEPI